jgi:protein-disulfide isomerase
MNKGKKQSEIRSLARSRQRVQQRRQKQTQSLTIMVIGAVLVVVALIAAVSSSDINPAETRDHPMVDGNMMGNPDAPVEMVIFSDFQCSHCRDFYQDTESYIIDNYIATGKVLYVYHSRGDSPGGDSGRATQATYCAGDQGKFWDMHDIIFSNFSATDNGGYSIKRLSSMAKEINLDVGVFKDCLNNNKYAGRVDEDATQASDKGVTGTPTFFINGQEIEGNQPLDIFIQVIQSELAKAGE